MTALVDIRPHDLSTVWRMLKRVLPEPSGVWVFGSRAVGNARRASDLDLAVDAGRPLTADETSALADAFEDSDLPYSVDVIDLRAVSETFAAIIASSRVPLPAADIEEYSA